MEPFFVENLAVWAHPSRNGAAVARVILVHGLSEHSGRHLNTIHFLTAQGIEVVRFDLRGAGRSGGARQWVDRFDDYVADTGRVFNWVEREREKLPTFLLGHSLGGAIAIHFATGYGPLLDGLILTAPAYLVGESLPEWKLRIGKLLVPWVPALRMPGGRDKSDLSRDPSIGPAFLADPLCSRFNTLGQGQAILTALEQVPEKCAQISLPVLIVHGSADRLIRPEGSQKILEALKSTDKTLHYMAGGFHEPHNDLDKEECFAILDRWIRAHLDVKSVPEKKAKRARAVGRATKAKRDRNV